MANGARKNWSRIRQLAGAFRTRYGCPPDRLEVSIAVWGDVRRLFTRGRFQEFVTATGLTLVEEPHAEAPRAVGPGSLMMTYAQAVEADSSSFKVPLPDRQEEEPDPQQAQWQVIALDRPRVLSHRFVTDPEDLIHRVTALNEQHGLTGDLALDPRRPWLGFFGNLEVRVPYVVLGLNPRTSDKDGAILGGSSTPERWWEYQARHWELLADYLDRESVRTGTPVTAWTLAPTWSILARLILGLEGLPVSRSPGAPALRLLQELVAHVELLPYSSKRFGAGHEALVRADPEYLDHALTLACAPEPELLIFNGAPYRRLLPLVGVEVPKVEHPVPGTGLRITPVKVKRRQGVVLNQFLSGRQARITKQALAMALPRLIQEVI